MSERFFRSSRPGYPHPVSSELENSDIRVAVGDWSVTERRRWHPPYQTGKTVHVHAKHYKHNENGCVRQWFCSVPLSRSGNVVTRTGIHTRTHRRLGLPFWVLYCHRGYIGYCPLWQKFKLQSTLVISKSKGPSKTVRDIRTSTYQICSIEEKTIWTTKFYKWLCNLAPLIRNIYWKYCGKGEKLLPWSNFSSFSQYFITWF